MNSILIGKYKNIIMSQQVTVAMFALLNLPIPDTVAAYSEELQREIYEYLSQMDESHKKAYCIAYQHLGSSFHITRSNGFKEWKCKEK